MVSDASALRGEHAAGLIPDARRALVDWIEEGGSAGREFLQLHLRSPAPGRYRVRHVEDRDRDSGELERLDDPYAAREVAQITTQGAHRPLKTAPDLRRGWSFEALDARGLWTALDYLYPACAVHWYAAGEGKLRVTHWRETAERQSGMYAAVKLLPEQAVRQAARACCADAVCLRRVAWGMSEGSPAPLPSEPADAAEGAPGESAVVPCPEPCSIFVSFARSVLAVERSPRADAARFGELKELELQQIRSVVEAAIDGTMHAPREGEFDEPLNRRRLRYLAIRLETVPAEGDPDSP